MMENVLDVVHIGQCFFFSVRVDTEEGYFPLANGEAMLLLSFDNMLVSDHLFKDASTGLIHG